MATNIANLTIGLALLAAPILIALIVFPMALIHSTTIASIFIDSTNTIYSGSTGSNQAEAWQPPQEPPVSLDDPRVKQALNIALKDPEVASILSLASWTLSWVNPIMDYNGLNLIFDLDRAVFVDKDFKQWYNPLGSVKIQGWTTQLSVDVDLDKAVVTALLPSEPRPHMVPPTEETAALLGKDGVKLVKGARMLEEYKEFRDIPGIEARVFWIVGFGPSKKAYYHMLDSNEKVVGVGCIDLNLMLIDKTCTARVYTLDGKADTGTASSSGVIPETLAPDYPEEIGLEGKPDTRQILPVAPIYRYGDMFYNFDFKTNSTLFPDWPINLVFFGYADIYKVKDIYGILPGFIRYAYVNDGYGWIWDHDRGVKKVLNLDKYCGKDLGLAFLHIRVYSDPDGVMVNYGWGNYVLATAHIDDIPQIPGVTATGFNDLAQQNATQIAQQKGYIVYNNYDYFNNAVGHCRIVGHIYYWHDGYVDFIWVPP